MSPLAAVLTAISASALTTMVLVAVLLLTVGHVHGDRESCTLANPGAVCALVWEPVREPS